MASIQLLWEAHYLKNVSHPCTELKSVMGSYPHEEGKHYQQHDIKKVLVIQQILSKLFILHPTYNYVYYCVPINLYISSQTHYARVFVYV